MSGRRSGAPLSALAPAKLNLGLWILRRRPDGYHDLLTLFQAVDLYDRLTVRPRRRGFSLTMNRRDLPRDGRNLVLKAARLLGEEAGGGRGADFRLEKRIPDGAGLGGGSSDAAAALLLLDRLWGLNLGLRRLAGLAARIGADVPFFLHGGAAVGRGRGDRLTPLPGGRTLHFLVTYGAAKIQTKWAYLNYKTRLTHHLPPPKIPAPTPPERIRGLFLDVMANHFEPAAAAVLPDIPARRERLLALGASRSGLTGSGSAVFGVFPSRQSARRAGFTLRREGVACSLCRSIPHGIVISGGTAGKYI